MSFLNSAGLFNAIPDSGGTHQWDHVDLGAGALTDSIASLVGSINGPDVVSGKGTGDNHLDYVSGNVDNTELPSASQTELDHFVNNATGTYLQWINPDTTSTLACLLGNTYNSDTAGFAFGFDSGDYKAFTTNGSGDGSNVVTGGSPITGSWYPAAFVLDAGSVTVYEGDPANDYTLNSISLGSIVAKSNGIATNVRFGDTNDAGGDNPYDGGQDYAFVDSTVRSQSNLQSIVDETKQFYR